MEILEQIITHLSKNEIKKIRHGLMRESKDSKVLQLFDIISSGTIKDSGEIEKALYPKSNKNAYYATRRRLMKDLTLFIVLEQYESDDSGDSQILGNLSVTRFLLKKNLAEPAKEMLDKSEEMAKRGHKLALLDGIYNLQLSNSDILDIDLPNLLTKWEDNLGQHLQMRKLNAAFAKIRKELTAKKKAGKTLDPEETIKTILEDFKFNRSLVTNPVFMHRLAVLCRSVVVSAKAYDFFEPYLIRGYNTLKSANALKAIHLELEIDFLYMIAHCQYRTRKFSESKMWLDKLLIAISTDSAHEHPNYSKYVALEAATALCIGNLQEAIHIIESALKNPHIKFHVKEKNNMLLNLAVYYFLAKKYTKSNEVIMQLPSKRKLLEDTNGREWLFKCDLISVILQYELDHIDIAQNWLRNMDRNYEDLLKEKVYVQAGKFLKFIHYFFQYPYDITTEKFATDIQNAKIGWDGPLDDIHAIIFFSWLKSKMTQRDCYEVMVERMRMKL